MQGILIFLLSIAAAILYGITHDLLTTRICLEYFTVAHPPVWNGTTNPTLLAFTWGIIATWWVGALLGIPLALAARAGRLSQRSAISMIKPLAVVLLFMAASATAAGLAAYFYYGTQAKTVLLFDPLTSGIPASHQLGFLVDAWMHLASYASGFLGGILLIAWTLLRRYKAEVHCALAELRNQTQRKS